MYETNGCLFRVGCFLKKRCYSQHSRLSLASSIPHIHVAGGSYSGKIHAAAWQDRSALCCWCWRNVNVYVNVVKCLKNNSAFGCEGGGESNILRTIAKAQFTGWLRSSTWYIFYILLPYLARPPPKHTISLRTVRKTPLNTTNVPCGRCFNLGMCGSLSWVSLTHTLGGCDWTQLSSTCRQQWIRKQNRYAHFTWSAFHP